mgnify:CR=1 FL=1
MIKIYLGDLVHDANKTNFVVPLNIAYIAEYVKKRFISEVDIKIFKYPKELEKNIKKSPPDILGLSNYSWNEVLNHVFIKMTKRLNPDVITVMGGPNIRTSNQGIKNYLSNNRLLDYYILFEGEETFCNLVEMILGGSNLIKLPVSCATLVKGELHYEPLDIKKKQKQINLPSPYLSGLLDRFLKDPNMIPLFETNRGCPFSCTYCTWGIAAFSKVRKRSLDMLLKELTYVARNSVGQVNWIFCDANFGIMERDLKIAKALRQIMDKYGYPIKATLWHSKNTSERNVEIAKILKDNNCSIAIQSTDPQVLKNSGRNSIKFSHLINQIKYYRENSFEVATDILIGLPGENAKSHLKTLMDAFDLDFGKIHPYNIRMLPGSKYESENDREKYKIKTKFRPIFGAYGTYDGQNVFEAEESIRATKDMSESELEEFKILHWLIYFCWNTGIFKPILFFAKHHAVNPTMVLHKLLYSKHPLLIEMFSEMKKKSCAEWFETKKDMDEHYNQLKNFDDLISNFAKLNFFWVANIYNNPKIISVLLSEITRIINLEIIIGSNEFQDTWKHLLKIVDRLLCRNLLQQEFILREEYNGKALSYVLCNHRLATIETIEVEIFRKKEDVAFCHYHLCQDGISDLSVQNITRFLEIGGMEMLTNSIKIVSG